MRSSCSSLGSHKNGGRMYQKSGVALSCFIIGTNRMQRSFLNTDDFRNSDSAIHVSMLNRVILVQSLGVDRVLSDTDFTSVPRAIRSAFGIEFLAISRSASEMSPPKARRFFGS